MSTSDSALEKNKQELEENLRSEVRQFALDRGLEGLLLRLVGAPAAIIMFLVHMVRSEIQLRRRMAQQLLRDEYGDNRIHLMGQQIMGDFSSEDCWRFINRAAGTLWVQDVIVTKSDGLPFVVFWHPDYEFKLKKNIIRVYRSKGNSMCHIEDVGPQLKAGR